MPSLTPTTSTFDSYPPQAITPLGRSSSESPEVLDHPIIDSTTARVWTPLPLRPIVYIPYCLLLVLLAVALQIAFNISQKNSGFKVIGNPNALGQQSSIWHYLYTLPLVALAMAIVGVWAWTYLEIKKLQPYVDLAQGNSPPHRSLLLDYTRNHNFFVWASALSNKHYTVFLAAILVLCTLAFQPLASALLDVRDVWWSLPLTTTTANSVLSIAPGIGDPNTPVGDLSVFLSASGHAAATAMYKIPRPPFVFVAEDGAGWSIMEVEIPQELPRNGTTVAMNTTALKTNVNCRSATVDMQQQGTAGNWTNLIQDEATGCSLTFNVSKTGPNLFGASVALCPDTPTSVETNPAVFWFFTYGKKPRASATICKPTVQLFDVTTTLLLGGDNDGHVLNVIQRNPFDLDNSPFAGSAANLSVLENPTTGLIQAFNALEWDPLAIANDSSVRDRLKAVQTIMPAAIFQSATSGGIDGVFDSDSFSDLSSKVYTSYLSLVATKLYFIPAQPDTNVQLQPKTTVKRLFLSPFSTHVLTALLILLALLSLFIQLTHAYSRRNLHLRHLPGTIASAVSIGGQTMTSALLDKSAPTEDDLQKVLHERGFRIDPITMKIVMEEDERYDYDTSPNRGGWTGA